MLQGVDGALFWQQGSAVGTTTGLCALEIRIRNLLPYDEIIHDEWKVRIPFWHQGITLPMVEETNNRSFYSVYRAMLADMHQAQTAGEIDVDIPVIVTSEFLLMTVIGSCVSCTNDSKLREKKALDRRVAMIMGFVKTGKAATLEIGDPEKEY